MCTLMVQEPDLTLVQGLGIESPVVEVVVDMVDSEQVLVPVGQVEVECFLQGNQDGIPFPCQFQNLTLRKEFFFIYLFEFFYLSGFGREV